MNTFSLEIRRRVLSFREEFRSNHPFPEPVKKTPNTYVKMEPGKGVKLGNFVDGAGTWSYTLQAEIELAHPEKVPCKLHVLEFTYVCTVQWIQAFINLNTNICSMHTNNNMRHICQIITSEQLDGGLIPASVLAQAAINSFLGSEEGFCYFSDTSVITPSEGQKLLLHSMYLSSEEVSLEEYCSPAPTNYRNYHTKEHWDFQTEERIHAPLNQQQ